MTRPPRLLVSACLWFALGALAACAKNPGANPDGGGTWTAPENDAGRHACVDGGTRPPVPVVHIGPDVSIDVPCEGMLNAPIASLSNQGDHELTWKVSSDGRLGVITPSEQGGSICPVLGVKVVSAVVTAPATANVGDTFDGTFTVSAPGGEFPTGTVTVHVRVVAPVITVNVDELDLGVIRANEPRRAMVFFRNETSSMLAVGLAQLPDLPFIFATPRVDLRPKFDTPIGVSFRASQPGTYATQATWESPPRVGAEPSACAVTKVIKLRARVLGPDAGDDAEVDAGSGMMSDGRDADVEQ